MFAQQKGSLSFLGEGFCKTSIVSFSMDVNLKAERGTSATNRIAMFAQPEESLPLRGGKKTASSLAPQATDEGGGSVSCLLCGSYFFCPS